MVKRCFHVSSISSFFFCLYVSSFFVNSLVSLPSPRPDQIEILMAFKNEFPILKCDFRKWPDSEQKTKYWTSKDVNSFDGVKFDNKTGVVTMLDLEGACLSGSLSANSSLFGLHHLRFLDLSFNYFDSFSFLPELAKLTNLELLDLSGTGLAGEIPSSVSSLNRLKNLVLYGNKLMGSLSPLFNLSKLIYLDLSDNLFSGNVPCSLLTMPFMLYLDLSQNQLIDSLETMNCSSSSKLETLSLGYNRLSGGILEPLSKLTNLKHLSLSFQNTTHPINFLSFGFKSLEFLDLSGNTISMPNTGSPNLEDLYLDNCGIKEFPPFVKNLQNLDTLHIAYNRLKGEVPKWLWSMPSLDALSLSHNSLDSFEGSPKILLNSSLRELDLRSNAFRGSLPVISPRMDLMFASNNSFTGDIPLSLCNQSDLLILDLAHNHFSGSIPPCLINSSVVYLDLGNNNLTGRLPDINDCPLGGLDVSHNQITGKLPRSLTNLKNLEVLNVEGNRIADTFPFWLKELPELQVLVLRSNMFHGPIYSPQYPLSFPQLRIIDISRNELTGSLPRDYFSNWSKLLISIPQEEREPTYMGGNLNLCGLPLEQSCLRDKVPSTPEAQEAEPLKKEQVLNWKAAAMGYGPGVLFGLAIGQVFYSYKPVLFCKLFRL
ncbi:hypothetical protein F2Q69_00016164 [Brassica cretica]|uniref:Leucine-rich repeat-containing N-terminal plant-type domain-containing protein n=1 Tax=Brassica cretica TaxID=69181 RepID=A0A8S9QQX1_BRACR|nr:hypothetical protein F2Q69_00016164 [Brassica cretica]